MDEKLQCKVISKSQSGFSTGLENLIFKAGKKNFQGSKQLKKWPFEVQIAGLFVSLTGAFQGSLQASVQGSVQASVQGSVRVSVQGSVQDTSTIKVCKWLKVCGSAGSAGKNKGCPGGAA